MQTTPSRELNREIVRLAIGAALIAFLLPLLPLYGGSVFSVGLPLRGLISFFLGWWTNVAVVAVGILFLRRDRIGVAGGIFVAVAMTLAFYDPSTQVLETAPHFGSWRTDLFLILEIMEGVLLSFAAVRAI